MVNSLRLNDASWPAWTRPSEHRYLTGEGEGKLKRKVKGKFDDPKDYPNRVRRFLIRANVLYAVTRSVNPEAKIVIQLSEEKRKLAVKYLYSSFVEKSLEELIKEWPELVGGEEIEVIIPTKYKKKPGEWVFSASSST